MVYLPILCSLDVSKWKNILGRNKLRNLKIIRKGYWKSLTLFEFGIIFVIKERNFITDIEKSTEIAGKEMNEIVIEQRGLDNLQCHDIRWIAKL